VFQRKKTRIILNKDPKKQIIRSIRRTWKKKSIHQNSQRSADFIEILKSMNSQLKREHGNPKELEVVKLL